MNFSWIVPFELAAMGCPRTESDLLFIKNEGIQHLITLSPETLPCEISIFERTNIFIEEFEAPTLAQILQFISICRKCRNQNQAVGVHCRMGRGRTGVMVACYLVRFYDVAPEKAITKIRLLRPGSIETKEQERAVLHYRDHYRKNVSDEEPET
ncbi:hypothetical protein FQR65_LT10612 [Abscondita terminalis]|nr:hypothetical protein FQR65_LT10612 [Abscondita terminalis]